MVMGDGEKFIQVDGVYIYFVSRSATDRLQHGDCVNVVILPNGYADLYVYK
jgi:hypothetical protein